MNPRFSLSELMAFYDQGYYEGNNDYSYQDERKHWKGSQYVWKARIQTLLKHYREKPVTETISLKLLDIGCSFGGLLYVAQQMGIDSYGLDVSDYAVEYARNLLGQHKIHHGVLDAARYPDDFFDFVTMIEVIEHLDDPAQVLKEIYRILRPGGIALIQTANMAGQQAIKAGANYHYYLPGHLFYFTADNLQEYARKIGFSHFHCFHGVEFGLLPKLKKIKHTFQTWKDYPKWISISLYHLKSKIHWNNFALTSSMVTYLFK